MQLHGIKNKTGLNRFLMSAKKWTNTTNAIGIKSKPGRYGGTYAHLDIAFHFCLWLSPTFQLYVSKEFQRLKVKENEENKEALTWNLKRTLAKINYRIHTDAIKEKLIPEKIYDLPNEKGLVYASEADILNLALFGTTAKVWRQKNPDKKGNIRDHASGEQLLVLANLESHNAEFIKQELGQKIRLSKLNEIAIYQMQALINQSVSQRLFGDTNKPKS